MAENKESNGGCDVGFFYYDWALSRYRWMDGNCFSKVSGFGPVKKMACSSSEVKAQVGGNRNKQSVCRLKMISSQTKKGGKSFSVEKVMILEQIVNSKLSKPLKQRLDT